MYMWLEADSYLREIQQAMGTDCLAESLILANQAINDGLDEIEDLVNHKDKDIDKEALQN